MSEQANQLDYEPRPPKSSKTGLTRLILGCIVRSTIAAVPVVTWEALATLRDDVVGIAVMSIFIGVLAALIPLTIVAFNDSVGHAPIPMWISSGLSYFASFCVALLVL